MGGAKKQAPETYSLRVTKNALQNINDITGYIAFIKHKPLTAIRVGDKIFKTINRIEKSQQRKNLPQCSMHELAYHFQGKRQRHCYSRHYPFFP